MSFKSYRITCIGCREIGVSIKFASCSGKSEFAKRLSGQRRIQVGMSSPPVRDGPAKSDGGGVVGFADSLQFESTGA